MFRSWFRTHVDKVAELLWHRPKFETASLVNHYAVDELASSTENSDKLQHVPTEPLPPPAVTVRSLPLFALIIGISRYADPEIPDLRGAVNDANAVEHFLVSEVGVSKDRIVKLRDEEATRAAILATMRSLAHNNAISVQDPILIYYAGHGSEALAPISGWETNSPNGMIQMLLPHDFELKGSQNAHAQGIFDITLSRILADIAEKKSDNITVIVDCCHSGSATRKNQSEPTLAVRGLELPSNYTIPVDFFTAETQPRSRAGKTQLNSHVLLAACKQRQVSHESHGHGLFTWALLTLLRQEGIDTLSYSDVITRMPHLPSQNPQCEGVNKNRILFDSKVHTSHSVVFMVQSKPGKPSEYTLEAGEAHGITNGAEFAVYSDKFLTSIIGSIVVSKPAPFTSRCSAVGGTPFILSHPAYAIQTRTGEGHDICLFIEPADAFLDLFGRLGDEMQRTDTIAYKRSFRLVDSDDDKPDLVIRMQGDRVKFEIKDTLCSQYGLTHMPFDDVRPDDTDLLLSILCSAADFYWRLRHSNKDDSLTRNINVECLKLETSGELTDDLDEIFVPQSGGRDLNINGTIFIDVGEEENTVYGYRIINTSNKFLYVALFYMDISDLSIVPYYLPAAAARGQADFSLSPNGSLTIGFGDGGWAPRTYYLRENQNVDVGFLKVYVSAEYVDYSVGINQPSPFKRARVGMFTPRNRGLWGSLTIPIIQRKGVTSG